MGDRIITLRNGTRVNMSTGEIISQGQAAISSPAEAFVLAKGRRWLFSIFRFCLVGVGIYFIGCGFHMEGYGVYHFVWRIVEYYCYGDFCLD